MTGLSAALSHRIDYLVQRQGIVSGNIANATTPEYIAKDISFEKLVANETGNLSATNAKHFAVGATPVRGGHEMIEDRTHLRHDGNSVKADVEMLKLQDIQINHRLASQLYNKHRGMQMMVLNSGGGR